MRNMMKSMCLVVLFVFALISIPSKSRSITHKHKRNLSFKINSTRHQNGEEYQYFVDIYSNCDSSKSGQGQISVLLGDDCDYEVGPVNIDDVSNKNFGQCEGGWIDIRTPEFLDDICDVNVYISGFDGWKLESISITRPYFYPVEFEFNEWIPEGWWIAQSTCPPYDWEACEGNAARSTPK